MNGKLLYKKYINNNQGGIVFDIRAYRACDSLKSINKKV